MPKWCCDIHRPTFNGHPNYNRTMGVLSQLVSPSLLGSLREEGKRREFRGVLWGRPQLFLPIDVAFFLSLVQQIAAPYLCVRSSPLDLGTWPLLLLVTSLQPCCNFIRFSSFVGPPASQRRISRTVSAVSTRSSARRLTRQLREWGPGEAQNSLLTVLGMRRSA